MVDTPAKLEGETPQAGAVEAQLRRAAGMAQCLERFDTPEDGHLYIEFFTGCVTDDAVRGLRDDLTKPAAALGAH